MNAKNIQSNLLGASITWIKAISEWSDEERKKVYASQKDGGVRWTPRWSGVVRSVFLDTEGQPAYTVQTETNELLEVHRILEPKVAEEPCWYDDPATLEQLAEHLVDLADSNVTEKFAIPLRDRAVRLRKGGR